MKISRLEIKATIPTRQYENIQPCIELQNVDLEEGTEFAEKVILGYIGKYSEHGAFKEKVPAQGVVKTITKKSFNEGVEVQFEPVSHTFKFGERTLTSATTYIKKFYKPFDSAAISKASAKAWEVDQKELKELWDSNGGLTSTFGTLVHLALEHYDKYKALGKKVQDKKSLEENYALPKHPLLRDLIKGFVEIDKFDGEVMSEVLLTDVESGFCGLSDRILITGGRKCRIQDYKINVESDKVDRNMKASAPFDKLPATKLTKYQIQMSFYANLLQRSGWEVEGIDAFVYEDKWIHYPLEVLKVI